MRDEKKRYTVVSRKKKNPSFKLFEWFLCDIQKRVYQYALFLDPWELMTCPARFNKKCTEVDLIPKVYVLFYKKYHDDTPRVVPDSCIRDIITSSSQCRTFPQDGAPTDCTTWNLPRGTVVYLQPLFGGERLH